MTTNNSFYHNECMNAITQLAEKHTTNAALGMAVREFLNDSNQDDPNQTQLNLNDSEDSDT